MGQTQSQLIYSLPFGEKKQGESQIYRNSKNSHQLLWKVEPHISTLQDAIENGNKLYGEVDFVGSYNKQTNQYQFEKYRTVYQKARAVGSGVVSLKLLNEVCEYKQYAMRVIGIYSKNRTEWNETDMACTLYGITTIPLYDTLGPESISHVLLNSSITSLFCSEQSAETILKTEKLHYLRNLILYDKIDEKLKEKIRQKGLHCYDYQEVMKQGQSNVLPLPVVKPDDVFTFSYTSGTTGLPKGAMLSHKNLVGSLCNESFSQLRVSCEDYQMCYLPLAHIMQRGFNVSSWYHGMKMCFTGGDIQKLKEDLQVIRPTIFGSVPRLFNRFYDLIQDQFRAKQGIAKSILDSAVAAKLENLHKENKMTHYVYDLIVFSKIRDLFGGRVRFCMTGSAPLSKDVLDFFKIALSCPFVEVYGQTEGTGLEFMTDVSDRESGHVGGVQNSIELKLVDIPEMNYFSHDRDEKGNSMPRGEICIRGHTVFLGYYKDDEKTREAIDEDGWLHSGDVGQLLPNGALKIIDRKKNIFKLSQGEYVAPEKVENIYQRVRGVGEIFVYGDSLQSHCVAIVVPNPEEIKKMAKEMNIHSEDLKTLCANQQIVEAYQKNMFAHGKKEGLFTFEQATKVYLEPVSMLVHGCLTNSLKLQRHQAKIHFKAVIDQLYGRQ